MKKQAKKYLSIAIVLVLLLLLTSCGSTDITEINGFNSFWDLFVWPMAGLMYGVGKTIAFGNYGLTIVITTIIVRTLAWPIYAKTNDMSLKMQIMAPDQAKLEAKYAGKTDPESMQRKQMEVMQLYKKYGVGFSGCLMPLLQFPIFIGFYQTLQRVPETRGGGFPLDFGFLKGNLFGLDLFQARPTGAGLFDSSVQNWGIIILAALVGITQILHQLSMSKRQKKAQAESQSNIPSYRQPQQTDMQKQTQLTMKIMMYGMTAMMVFFVYRSTAALGLYWLVGNLYSTLQGYIGNKSSKGRMEKLKSKI